MDLFTQSAIARARRKELSASEPNDQSSSVFVTKVTTTVAWRNTAAIGKSAPPTNYKRCFMARLRGRVVIWRTII